MPYEIGHASGCRKLILPYLTHPALEVPSYLRDIKHVADLEGLRKYFAEVFPVQLKSLTPRRADVRQRLEERVFKITVPQRLNGRGSIRDRISVSHFPELWTVIDSPTHIEAISVELEYLLTEGTDHTGGWGEWPPFIGLLHQQKSRSISQNTDLGLSSTWQTAKVAVAGEFRGYSLDLAVPTGFQIELRNCTARTIAVYSR